MPPHAPGRLDARRAGGGPAGGRGRGDGRSGADAQPAAALGRGAGAQRDPARVRRRAARRRAVCREAAAPHRDPRGNSVSAPPRPPARRRSANGASDGGHARSNLRDRESFRRAPRERVPRRAVRNPWPVHWASPSRRNRSSRTRCSPRPPAFRSGSAPIDRWPAPRIPSSCRFTAARGSTDRPADDPVPARYLASRGYVVFAVDYRHAPAFRWPAQLDDLRQALRWIDEHAAEFGAGPDADGGARALRGGPSRADAGVFRKRAGGACGRQPVWPGGSDSRLRGGAAAGPYRRPRHAHDVHGRRRRHAMAEAYQAGIADHLRVAPAAADAADHRRPRSRRAAACSPRGWMRPCEPPGTDPC